MNASLPTISIVIAVLNAAEDLRLTLASIESQGSGSRRRVETIIVDGRSTDRTLEVARSSPVPDVVVSEADAGIYDAMNKGALLASGRWLHFLNAGDSFEASDSLAAALAGIDAAEVADRTWFISGARYVGGAEHGRIIPNVPHVWWRHALGTQPHCHQATWFRRDLFLAVGGYSLDYAFIGDFDLILRWGLTGPPQEDPRVLIAYTSGGLSAQRAAEVPALLGRVRRDRLNLTGAALVGERALAAALRGIRAVSRVAWFVQAVPTAVGKRLGRPAGPPDSTPRPT